MTGDFLAWRSARALEYLHERVGAEGAVELARGSHDAGDVGGVSDISVNAAKYGLLPDPKIQIRLTWAGLCLRLPSFRGVALRHEQGVIDMLKESVSDRRLFEKEVEVVFPFRTKTDRALRRTRLRDWVLIFRNAKREDECWDVFTTSKVGWDQIFIQNLVVARYLLGDEWWRNWERAGAFEGDLEHYEAVTSAASNLIKTSGLDVPDWLFYVENAGLVGYRNLPYAGFDLKAEAEKKAAGGAEHNYFGRSWDNLVQEFLPMASKTVPYITFRDYVLSGEWVTSGASSVGDVEVAIPSTTKKGEMEVMSFRARKNMVADVYDLGVLADAARATVEQVNATVVKCELGKVRLAVSGDIHTYLKMAWIGRLLGGGDKSWPGSTSDETFSEQTLRMHHMLRLCAQGFGMPYDYKGFEHQPTTVELQVIVRHFIKTARANVPAPYASEFDGIAECVVHGFDWSTLVTRNVGVEPLVLDVTGGLMSGLAWTSKIGNAWNSVMTGLAMWMLEQWSVDVSTLKRYIRGDDSAIFAATWETCAAMDLAYKAIGAIGGEGKYSVQLGATEFLRTWYSDHCSGYPARSIPAMTQRKPWSNNPWSPGMVMEALWSATRTLYRRLADRAIWAHRAWAGCKWTWCRLHGLPLDVLKVPRESGGLGIEPPDLSTSYSMEYRLPDSPRLRGAVPLNQTPWRAQKIQAYFLERYCIRVDDQRAAELAARALLDTVGSDNVPEYAIAMRAEWTDEVKRGRFPVKRHHVRGLRIPILSTEALANMSPELVPAYIERVRSQAPLYGACPEVAVARVDYATLELDLSFSDFLRRYYPRVDALRKKFHRGWHLTEILDYLEGRVRVIADTVHPALVGLLSALVARACQPAVGGSHYAMMWTARIFEPPLAASLISRAVYWW